MAQTHEGAIKAAAAHVGLSYEEYLAKQAAGEKWCTGCKAWHQRSAFGRDSHRSDGLASSCLDYHKRRFLENYQPRPRPAAGRRFKEARDKMQARGRVNHLDGQTGYNCSIFRNESSRLSSEIIGEAEQLAFAKWGPNRVYTYVDGRKIRSSNPGFCFQKAGWQKVGISARGLILLVKDAPQ